MEKLWGLGPVIARDPDFATVNLPWNGIFLTAEGKPVDAFGLPVPTLPRPVPATQKPDPCRLPLAPAARRPLRRVTAIRLAAKPCGLSSAGIATMSGAIPASSPRPNRPEPLPEVPPG